MSHARHRLFVRVTHWINAVAFLSMLTSGILILLAHPRLYWGETGYFDAPALLDLRLPVVLDTSGWARSLHFATAWVLVINGLAYLTTSITSGHVTNDLLPTRHQLQPLHILRDIHNHVRLRVDPLEAAREYNLLQKLAYLSVLFVCFPMILLTGLTLSPAVTAALPGLFDLFLGRQSARTIHFALAATLLAFLAIHLFQVCLLGFWSPVRAMTVGGHPKEET